MQRRLFIIGGALLGFSLAVILTWNRLAPTQPSLHGTYVDPPMLMPDFRLESGTQIVTKSQFRGRIVVMAFGYTSCPDFCPTTMSRLARALEILGEESDKVQVLLVSVDPERDTPERVNDYAREFNPAFLGLSGEPAQVGEVAKAFGIYHEHGEHSETAGYLVDHTTTVTALDDEGNLRVLWSFETPPEHIAEDLHFLLSML